ncbi:hypothetical protein BGX27_002039 [Mortierella sp. AM989]|nr:hypothetical protein BGX27_002039 [Mortierella sp. AM989]
MGYEYILIVAAILIPLALFSVFKGDQVAGTHSGKKKASFPGAFGDTTSKSKKKKPKKKSATAKGNSAEAVGYSAEKEKDTSESEVETKVVAQPSKKNNVTTTQVKSGKVKNESAKVIKSSNGNNNDNASSKSNNDDTNKTKSKDSAIALPTIPTVSASFVDDASKTAKPASVENWKKQKQEQQKELLAKQQEQLQFASAAARNASFDSSPHIASIPGPGAMGNNKKKNRNNAASGLSHSEFPALSKPEPASASVPKQPKQPKQKKDPVKKPEPKPEPEPEPEPEISQSEEEEEEEEELQSQASSTDDDASQDDKKEEWTTVSSTQSRSGGIDFSKPMDPWVAQQQRQRLERIAVVDPHGEQIENFARVLSIKPTAKVERIHEDLPDGFQTQKSRSGTSSGGSNQYQSAELTKKQRENLAKAAKKKEEKAAMDAAQEKRRLEHMRQVKAEKMKEFYRSQTRKQTPVESRWDVPKTGAPSSSTVSGDSVSAQTDKGQLAWD